MKRAAEIKPSVRSSEEPVAGDGSICVVSFSKRAKLEEPEAANGVIRRSPKLVAADGTLKRARNPEKPSNKDKGAEEKCKRSKKKKTACWMKKKKKVVTWRLSQELLEYLRTKEVMGLVATEAPLPPWASRMGVALFDLDQRLKEEIAAEFQEHREFNAHVLYQYPTKGYVEIQEEVDDKEHDVEADGILVGKLEKPSKKEKGAEEECKRFNQEKKKQPNKVEVCVTTLEAELVAQLEEQEKKNMRLLVVELTQPLMKNYLSHEILDYMVVKPMDTIGKCYSHQAWGVCDPDTDARICFSSIKSIETQASVLQQYHAKGSAAIQYYAPDDKVE